MTREGSTIIVALLAIAGCTEAFDPNVSGPRPFAVFAVLNTLSDSQIVRLTDTSDPTEPHPSIRPVTGALVTIDGPGGTIPCVPSQRAGEPGMPDSVITEYVATPFRPQRGGTYTLRVSAPSGTAVASVVVPSANVSAISVQNFIILQDPHSYPLSTLLGVNTILAPQTLGLMVRFVVEYEVLQAGVWHVEQIEVPLGYPTGPNESEIIYPRLVRRSNTAPNDGRSAAAEAVYLPLRAYEETLSRLHEKFGSPNLRMRRAVFYLVQADRHFFTYYSFANGFEDPLSIRVDQPNYSNVTGGIGIFGAISVDSVAYALPANLRPRGE
jgi:hypothetical protein